MGINVNMDYSTLFSSMSGGSSSNNYLSGLSSMLSDYSSIKNGSYGKLVSAYYKKVGNEKTSSADDDDSSAKKSEVGTAKSAAAEKKQYTSLASDAKSLSANAEKLSSDKSDLFDKTWQNVTDEDGVESKVYDYDSSRIMKAVSSFVKDYNSIVSTAGDLSDVTTDARVSYMEKITSSYKKELSSIGITVKDNGKLSLNKDKMQESGMESVANVLGGKSGYAYQISSAASLLESSATKAASNTSTYSSRGALNSDFSSIMDSFI